MTEKTTGEWCEMIDNSYRHLDMHDSYDIALRQLVDACTSHYPIWNENELVNVIQEAVLAYVGKTYRTITEMRSE